jgi:hypothetical protein
LCTNKIKKIRGGAMKILAGKKVKPRRIVGKLYEDAYNQVADYLVPFADVTPVYVEDVYVEFKVLFDNHGCRARGEIRVSNNELNLCFWLTESAIKDNTIEDIKILQNCVSVFDNSLNQ